MNHIGIGHKLEINKQTKLCKVMITVIFQKTMLKYNSNRSTCFFKFYLVFCLLNAFLQSFCSFKTQI
jgi:hypothetical protein